MIYYNLGSDYLFLFSYAVVAIERCYVFHKIVCDTMMTNRCIPVHIKLSIRTPHGPLCILFIIQSDYRDSFYESGTDIVV